MKKKLSAVKSQPKIPSQPTGSTAQPTTHKILAKHKKLSTGSFMSNLKNKQNDVELLKVRQELEPKRFESALNLISPSTLEERLDSKKEQTHVRSNSRKVQPSYQKYANNYPSIASHRSPSHKRQFLFCQNPSLNSPKPLSGTSSRGKRFSSIRKSEVTLNTQQQPCKTTSTKQYDTNVVRLDKKESVWGKRQLILGGQKQNKKALKQSTVAPSTTKQKSGTSLSKFLTQVAPPKTILQVHSYSNLLSPAVTTPSYSYYYISTLVQAFSDKTNNTSFMQLARNHMFMTLQVLNITKNIEKPNSNFEQPASDKPLSATRNTLVFDLDQTLIHCNQSIEVPHDVLLNITFPNGDSTKAGINVRQHAHQILRELSDLFDIVIFTASHQCYANVVINHLDPEGAYVKARYFRDSCYRTPEGLYVKDLRVLGIPLQKVLLIDNAAYSYAFQLDNGVPIIPFYDDKTDQQLKHLSTYLKQYSNTRDIRKENCRYFKTRHFSNFSDPLQLLKTLFTNCVQQQ